LFSDKFAASLLVLLRLVWGICSYTINKYLVVLTTLAVTPATKRYILPSIGEKSINCKGMQEIADHRPTEKEHSPEEETLHEDMQEMRGQKCSNRQEVQEMQEFEPAVEEAREVSLIGTL
jgi:antirestriction protein